MMRVLKGETLSPPPLWMMRQAGRYLPEYRETRKQAKNFLDLCYSPDLAVEVTHQPIRRFGFDAAILFSDILVVPHALGRDVTFSEGSGPAMPPIDADGIHALSDVKAHEVLAPVYETVRRLAAELAAETTLIGFCGAPWTVATYMIAGHGTPDQAPARLFAYREPAAFERLLDVIADLSAEYLFRQVQAGADCVQIFDSWASVLDDESFARFCIRPVRRIIDGLRARGCTAPVIAFPKGASALYQGYREATRADALGLDWTMPLGMARDLQKEGAVQGNLDPLLLIAGGDALDHGVDRILQALGSGPLIFNLGHGITPQAPISNVTRMIKRVRGANAG
ncbi:MAG: uroporphyrinogen decarboxylase [Rhizobiaceae bacterium]|nr:uroporphyrinogen decarboxylase [Rhizobiaceae bacterium]